MKKFKKILFLVICFLLIDIVNANSVNKVDMDIYIDSLGDAHIKETWNYTSNKDTEIYHGYSSLGKSSITDFMVSDNTGVDYSYVNNWNIKGSFDDKKYKYGYNRTSNGVELCLGISHYGTYTYYLNYTIKNFVYDLNDSQLVYWELLPKFDTGVKSYSVKIYSDKAFSDDLAVWGYGKYGAYAYVYEGAIYLSSDDRLKNDEYVTVLVKFPKEYFSPREKLNNDFEYYLNMANNDAKTYKENRVGNFITFIISNVLVFGFDLFIFFLIFIGIKNTKNYGSRVGKKNISKDAPIFRDLPCGKDVSKAYFIGSEYNTVNKETNLFGALLLKWLKDGKVKIESDNKTKFDKKKTKILLLSDPFLDMENEFETKLYKYIYKASKDGILENNEFEKWCRNNYDKIYSLFNDVIDNEVKKSLESGLIVNNDKKISLTKYVATDKFDEIGNYMIGLKKFFKEFASMEDKSAIEVMLWQDYLIYAQLFGMAKEVAKEFKRLYPEILIDDVYNDVVIINSFSSYGQSAVSSARSRAQSYSSGGGGFSSGGGGGGSFGGGGSAGSR